MKDSALYDEADQVQQAARAYVLAVSSVLSLLLLVLGAGVSFGLIDDRKPVLITLPFLLSGLLVYMLQLITEYRARLGIRRAIEGHFSGGQAADRLISGTVLGSVVGTGRSSVLWSSVLFGAAAVAVDGLAIWAAREVFWRSPVRTGLGWRLGGVGYYCALALSFVPLWVAWREADGAELAGLDAAKLLIEAPPDVEQSE